jgi:uncharacterized protein YdgA (DUF945 family)
MDGNKSRRKPGRRRELEDILGKMETYIEAKEFEKLDELADLFEKKLDLALKEGSLDPITLKRFLDILKHLEEKALKAKEELKKSEKVMKKLKHYKDFT